MLLLIFMGALVTSNQAGLAVPDWPTSYGENMFLFPPSKWVGGIFYEHVHRLIASGIGFLTVVLTIWLWRVEPRGWVRFLGVLALFAVILQGVLGGLTVLFLLPPAVSACHAVLGQSFFILTIAIAYSQSRELASGREGDRALFKYALIAALLVYLQLIVGAVMRHTQAGLAVPDFPRMGGEWLPALDAAMIENLNRMRKEIGMGNVSVFQVVIHLLHRAGAIAVFVGVAILFAAALGKSADPAPSSARRRMHAYVLGAMIVAQISLGILTVLSLKSPVTTSLHVALGAALLGFCVLTALREWPQS